MTLRIESAQSLRLQLLCNGMEIGAAATGFIVERGGEYFLITNRHVLSGLNTFTGERLSSDGSRPTHIRVFQTTSTAGHPDMFYRWTDVTYPLIDDDGSFTPRWFEHPDNPTFDVAGLHLPKGPLGIGATTIVPLPIDISERPPADAVALSVTSPLSIVGFPMGSNIQNTAIWVHASVASEPDLDYDGRPAFLVDCRARPGSSGSPVLAQAGGGVVQMADGGSRIGFDFETQIVGVYSGRISADSDLGIVWRLSAVRRLLDNARLLLYSVAPAVPPDQPSPPGSTTGTQSSPS